MKKYANRFCCTMLILIMLLSLFPPMAFAADVDFSEHFTDVSITNPDGSLLASPVAKEAVVKITCNYILNSDLTAAGNKYTFNIPALVAPKTPLSNTASDGVDDLFTFTVGTDGKVEVVFTQYAEDEDYLDAGAIGFVSFESALDPSNIPGGGPKELTFFPSAVNPTKFTLTFAPDRITASGVIRDYDATVIPAQNQIKWTFNFTPSMGNNNLGKTGENKITDLVFDIDLDGLDFLSAPVSTAALTGSGSLDAPPTFDATTTAGRLFCEISDYTYAAGDVIAVTYYTAYDMAAFKDGNTASFNGSVSGSFEYPQYELDDAGAISLISAAETATTNKPTVNADVTAQFLDKTQTLNKSTMEITWTVTVNGSGFDFGGSNFNVTDAIPKGLKLKSVTLDSTAISSPAYTGSDYSGGTLTVSVSPNDAHTIVYVTEIDPDIWKKESYGSFKNDVWYEVEYDGVGYDFRRTKTATGNFAGTSGGLISGVGSYDRTNHTITWEIGVNNYATTLENGEVEIKIPAGLTYDESDPIVLPTGYGAVYDSDTRTITVTLPTSLSAEGMMTLKTTVDNELLWATNNTTGTSKTITANLTTPDGIDLTVKPSTSVVSEVISKEATGYDYATKEITWSVTFNQNKMVMTTPIIVDTLPEGISYVDGSATATGDAVILTDGVTYDEATEATRGELTIAFEDTDAVKTKSYGFTFKTLVAESQRQEPTDILNTAEISFDELAGNPAVSTTATRSVGASSLIKTGTENGSDRTLTWTVNINTNEVERPINIIEDALQDGLLLDLESIQLYECTVNADGSLTQDTLVYDGKTPTVTNDDYDATLSGQLFTFTFKNTITKAYQLVFTTDNLVAVGKSYTNAVNFQGESSGSSSSSGPITQGAVASGGITRPERGSIELTATEKNGTPIADIIYTITGTNLGNVYTVTTDKNGLAYFLPLKYDTYTITQASVPDGFGLVDALPTITVSDTNKTPDALIKYDNAATPVTLTYDSNGGTGTGYTDESYVPVVEVTVKANPFTRASYTFVGWNTRADGSGAAYDPADTFWISADTTLYAIWTWVGGSDSGLPATPPAATPADTETPPESGEQETPPEIPPVPRPPAALPNGWLNTSSVDVSAYTGVPLARGRGGLVLSAVTVNGIAVPGVVFQIELNGVAVSQSTDQNGVAVFRDIEPGNYVVKAVSIPAGYQFDMESEITIAVQEDEYVIAEALLPLSDMIPKTGDMFPQTTFWAIAIISLILSLISGYIVLRRKKLERNTAD